MHRIFFLILISVFVTSLLKPDLASAETKLIEQPEKFEKINHSKAEAISEFLKSNYKNAEFDTIEESRIRDIFSAKNKLNKTIFYIDELEKYIFIGEFIDYKTKQIINGDQRTQVLQCKKNEITVLSLQKKFPKMGFSSILTIDNRLKSIKDKNGDSIYLWLNCYIFIGAILDIQNSSFLQ